jgi:hypothetical protein
VGCCQACSSVTVNSFFLPHLRSHPPIWAFEKVQLVETTFSLGSEAMSLPKRLFMASELLKQLVFCESLLVMCRLLYLLT